MKITNDEGVEVEVFTQEERDAFVAAEVEKKVGETKTDYETRIKEREDYFVKQGQNAGQLRKINEETIAKMSIVEREKAELINKLVDTEAARAASEKKVIDDRVEATIKAKANGNADLEAKIRANMEFVNITPTSAEQVETKVGFALGAVYQQNPDILAIAAAHGGTVYPGGKKPEEKKESFADTARGKEIAAASGFILEIPKTN